MYHDFAPNYQSFILTLFLQIARYFPRRFNWTYSKMRPLWTSNLPRCTVTIILNIHDFDFYLTHVFVHFYDLSGFGLFFYAFDNLDQWFVQVLNLADRTGAHVDECLIHLLNSMLSRRLRPRCMCTRACVSGRVSRIHDVGVVRITEKIRRINILINGAIRKLIDSFRTILNNISPSRLKELCVLLLHMNSLVLLLQKLQTVWWI